MQALPPLPPAMGDPERPAYIVFTSGSSGTARPVCHAHRAIWARRMMWDGWYGLRVNDRLMHAGAFNWTYTMGTGLMDPWAIGATALIPAEGTPAIALPGLLAAHEATIFAAAPGVYRQMLRAAMPPLPALRHGLSAGETLPDVTRAAWQAATGTLVHEALGMSECSTYISGSPARPAPPGTVGFPQAGRHLSVRADGAPVAHDTQGALCLHRDEPGLMLGYWAGDGPAPLSGTWFGTGDQVSMARDGAITYLGRNDDMMNAGGFRVSPLEVEAALTRTPGVQDIAACEIRLSADTSVIAAFHVGGAEDALRATAQASLARYKQPRLYVARKSLPRNANGKINRRALRESTDF
jgi:acyl-coenzyme A synthetase/AMP-(fatty) acid ligase